MPRGPLTPRCEALEEVLYDSLVELFSMFDAIVHLILNVFHGHLHCY